MGQAIFSYKANDGQRDSETVSVVTINVINYNRKPLAHAGPNQEALSGTLVTLDGSGSSDFENEALTYRWELPTKPMTSRSQLANPHSVTPAFITDRDGTYIARLVVNDGNLDSRPSEVTITVTGEANAAPTLSVIASPQTIEMGTELRLTLSGSDTDANDTLAFLATGLPENSRLDGGTGKFRFQPSPSQVGDHTVTFMVTDGQQTHSQDVVFRVQAAAPNQVTALKSRVLDAQEFSEGRTVPLPGVRISVEDSTVTATSDANGYFTLSNIPHGAKIVSLDATGLRASNGYHYANFKGRLKIVQNVLNRPYRDYMLPLVNPVHISMVNPASSTVVNNNDIGVSMTVPTGTAKNPDGTMYRGPLSISTVPINATPRELPDVLRPSFLITLQPVNVRFETPVPITFPNTDNLAPETLVDLFSLSERGGFEKVGIGRVSMDGRIISIIDGGIRSTTWHFIIPMVPNFNGNSNGNGGDDNDNNGGSNNCNGSIICVATGTLREEHQFPDVTISGRLVNLNLAYTNTNSLQYITLNSIYEYGPVMSSSGSGLGFGRPTGLMSVSFGLSGRITPEVFFDTRNISSNESFAIGQQINTEGIKTGIYRLTTRLKIFSEDLADPAGRISIRMTENHSYHPIISPKTEFGMGWRLKELHSLHGINGELDASHERVMLLLDNFRYLVFKRNSDGSYTSPKGDYSTLEAIPAPVGGFLRKTKMGETYVFNSEGSLLGWVDRYGKANNRGRNPRYRGPPAQIRTYSLKYSAPTLGYAA